MTVIAFFILGIMMAITEPVELEERGCDNYGKKNSSGGKLKIVLVYKHILSALFVYLSLHCGNGASDFH